MPKQNLVPQIIEQQQKIPHFSFDNFQSLVQSDCSPHTYGLRWNIPILTLKKKPTMYAALKSSRKVIEKQSLLALDFTYKGRFSFHAHLLHSHLLPVKTKMRVLNFKSDFPTTKLFKQEQ